VTALRMWEVMTANHEVRRAQLLGHTQAEQISHSSRPEQGLSKMDLAKVRLPVAGTTFVEIVRSMVVSWPTEIDVGRVSAEGYHKVSASRHQIPPSCARAHPLGGMSRSPSPRTVGRC
jgi:hypothetical protein